MRRVCQLQLGSLESAIEVHLHAIMIQMAKTALLTILWSADDDDGVDGGRRLLQSETLISTAIIK